MKNRRHNRVPAVFKDRGLTAEFLPPDSFGDHNRDVVFRLKEVATAARFPFRLRLLREFQER